MPFIYFVETCVGYDDLIDNVAKGEPTRIYNPKKGYYEWTYECCLCDDAHTSPVSHLAKREYP